ncbi:MAG: hypothetical protein AABY93_18485 [Bacteroidota bacterium]
MALREFSEFEKKVIKEKLIKNGGKLSSLFENDFNNEVRIIVYYYESKNRKFELRSEKYSGDQIYNALVDMIQLLNFLLENDYLYRHFLPATNLNDFNVEKQISIGDFNGSKSLNFLASDDQNFISDFILKNENVIFKAAEPLRALAKRDFSSQEEIQHIQIIKQSKKSTSTSLFIGIGTILVGIGSIVGTCSEKKDSSQVLFKMMGEIEQKIDQSIKNDSSQEKKYLKLKDRLDSMKRSIYKRRKNHNNKKSVLKK